MGKGYWTRQLNHRNQIGQPPSQSLPSLQSSFNNFSSSYNNHPYNSSSSLQQPPECKWCRDDYNHSTNNANNNNNNTTTNNCNNNNNKYGHNNDDDELIQCLECSIIGCGSLSLSSNYWSRHHKNQQQQTQQPSPLSPPPKNQKQHILQHFLLTGHTMGISCGKKGSLYCFKCGDVVYISSPT